MDQAKIAAIILSGGKSERMGSPKALLRYHGQTFLEIILATIESAGIDCRIVVAGHHRDAIVEAFPNISLTYNPDYELGMSTSVQAGIRALPPGMDGAAIFLVDHPRIDRGTIDALVRHLAPGRIVVPVHLGRRGHPVLLAAGIFSEVLQLPPDLGLNTVVHQNPDRVVEVEVDDAGVLQDIDTPEQFSRLLREDL